MFPRTLAVLIIAGVISSCVAAQELARPTDATVRGFHGPIHSERMTTRKFGPDPRTDRKLRIRPSPAWLVFDPTGQLIETANDDGEGTLINHVRTRYDALGSVSTTNGRILRNVVEKRSGGTVETKTFENEVFIGRTTQRYDDRGDLVESIAYDARGEVEIRENYAYEKGKITDLRIWEANGESDVHVGYRFNDDGDLVLSTFYDKDGSPVTIFSLQGVQLTSYWQDPNCACSHNSVGVTADGVTYRYRALPDGSLEATVTSHPGSETHLEPSEIERYAGNHVLVDKLTFTYERDTQGNWTKRTVSARDPNTGMMIPIQEDIRTLTYY